MRKKTTIPALLLIFSFILILSNAAFADGFIVPRPLPDRPVPPYLTIKYHRVTVDIEDQVATTQVDQVFINDTGQDLEGDYIFPLPENAAISSFQMDVDGKMVEGKILDKDEARQIYEDIVRRRKDPALLEYVGRNMFRARVYPIPAHGEKRLRIKYSQILNGENGIVKYDYPLDTERFSPKPLKDVSVAISIKSKIPIKSFYSPSHKMSVTQKDDHTIKASYEETNVTPDKDVVIYYTLSDKDFGLNLITHKEQNEKEGFFLMFISPREKISKGDVLPKDVIFVLDRSGSMGDKGKMENAIKALNFCLSNLNESDRFNIVTFADEAETFASGLMPASKETVNRAKNFVDKTKPTGGTNIKDALLSSLKSFRSSERAKYIIFLTDGLPTVGETDIDEIQSSIKKSNTNRVRIFTFGVGYDVNTRLLDKLAQDGRGYSEYIKPEEDMEIKISSFFKKIADPLLSDIELKFTNVEISSIYPKELPDIFKGSQLVVVGKYRGSGPAAIKLTGKQGKNDFAQTYEANFPKDNPKNDFVPRLWAIRRIGYLLDIIKSGENQKELVDEVVNLSKTYGIITPYTSFLVTEPKDDYVDYDAGKYKGRPAPAAPSQAYQRQKLMENMPGTASGKGAVDSSTNINAYQQSDKPMEEDEVTKTKMKQILNKTFYLKNNIWTDSEYTGKEDIIKVKFGSDEYFQLAKDKKFAKYLSAGDQVLILYKGKTYLIEP